MSETSKQYNRIYRKIVNSEEDLVELMAYAIYKESKIKEIERHFNEHGRPPTDEQMSAFHRFSEGQVDNYLDLANQKFAYMLEILKRELIEDYRKEQKEEQKKAIEKLKPTFWNYAWAGIVGSSAFTLFISLILIILNTFDYSLVEFLVEKVLSVVHQKQ